MPEVSLNKNNSVLPKQILWEFGNVGTAGGGARGKPEQGTPTDLLAHYRLTLGQFVNVAPRTYGVAVVNTDDTQTVSAAVTSQTPFTYTAPASDFVRVEVWAELAHNVNLARWVLAVRVTRNGYTSDNEFSFHRVKNSATSWHMAINERVWLERDDALQIEIRAFNTSGATETLTINNGTIKLWSA
jgi:hypothetical protein